MGNKIYHFERCIVRIISEGMGEEAHEGGGSIERAVVARGDV